MPSFGAGVPQAKAVESSSRNAELLQVIQQLLEIIAQLQARLAVQSSEGSGGKYYSPSPSPTLVPASDPVGAPSITISKSGYYDLNMKEYDIA